MCHLPGWAIFWDAVGPELKWVETVSVENTIGLLKGMQEQGMLADEMDTDTMVDDAISPASDRLRRDFGDAYRTPIVHGFLVMVVSLVVLVLSCIPNQKSRSGV
ncbi:MAG: hypothetical protein ACWA5W_08030 [Phycisphaerales bacterium]